MNEFYDQYVSLDEKNRLRHLEPFDEFEEWHLKCSHYLLVSGSKGLCLSAHNFLWRNLNRYHGNSALSDDPLQSSCVERHLNYCPSASTVNNDSDCISAVTCDENFKFFNWQLMSDINSKLLRRFGHASCLFHEWKQSNALVTNQTACVNTDIGINSGPSNDFVVVTGGFGILEGKHQRLGNISLMNTSSNHIFDVNLLETEHMHLNRMHHTASFINSVGVLLIGGRLSPSMPLFNPCLVRLQPINDTEVESATSDSNSACYANAKQIPIDKEYTVTSDAIIRVNNSSENIAFKLSSQCVSTTGNCPCARWRHASAVYQKNTG